MIKKIKGLWIEFFKHLKAGAIKPKLRKAKLVR